MKNHPRRKKAKGRSPSPSKGAHLPASRSPSKKGAQGGIVPLTQKAPLPHIALVEGLRCVGPTLTVQELLALKERIKEWQGSESFKRGFHALALLSGRVRLLVLWLLSQRPLCVCDLAEILDDSVSNLSHQLRSLRQAGWVTGKRVGKAIEYTLTPEGERTLAILNRLFYGADPHISKNAGEPLPSSRHSHHQASEPSQKGAQR